MVMMGDWQEFFQFLKLRWVNFNPERTLKVYGATEKSLLQYHQTSVQNNKYNIENRPGEDKRLRDEEIISQTEYLAMKKGDGSAKSKEELNQDS